MNQSPIFKYIALSLLALGVVACSDPPAPDGSPATAPPSTGGDAAPVGGTDGDVAKGDVKVGGVEDGSPLPEFRATRAALQPIAESNAKVGKKMEEACAKAEGAVAAGSTEAADKHLGKMFELLGSAALGALPAHNLSAVYAAVAKDVAGLKGLKGAPGLKVTESENTLCGVDGKCSKKAKGAVCYTVLFPSGQSSCGCTGPEAKAEGKAIVESEAEAAENEKAGELQAAPEAKAAAKKEVE